MSGHAVSVTERRNHHYARGLWCIFAPILAACGYPTNVEQADYQAAVSEQGPVVAPAPDSIPSAVEQSTVPVTSSVPITAVGEAEVTTVSTPSATPSPPSTSPSIVTEVHTEAPTVSPLVGFVTADGVEPSHPAVLPFSFSFTPVSAARLGSSWRSGCPVSPSQLMLITISYWGFDRSIHTGELIVNSSVIWQVAAAFEQMWKAHYPIQSISTIDAFGSNDDASMQANNTSAFNCRYVSGTNRWSMHAYGLALDLNPQINPYVSSGGSVSPPNGAPYVVRQLSHPAMILEGSPPVVAFDSIGWGWGGRWSGSRDYQHFSSNGR